MRIVLSAVWLGALLIGVFCMGLFVQGKIRDQRTGQPDVAIDLSSPASSGSRSFRTWRAGEYDLALSSVNHTPPFDVPFRGKLEVSLISHDGRELLKTIVDSATGPHVRPNNMSWTPLDSIRLERGFGKLRLSARVIEADPQFSGVQSRINLRLRQYEPGMGGMMNYIMLAPGILFLTIAVGVAMNLAQKGGGPIPLRITIALAAILGIAALL